MMGYGKRVVYLSCVERGEKVGSAGFIKIRIEKDRCGMDMHVLGVNGAEDGRYDVCAVLFDGSEYVLGKVYVHGGKGEWKVDYAGRVTGKRERDGEESEETGLEYGDIESFRVKISAGRWLEGNSGNAKRKETVDKAGEAKAEADKAADNADRFVEKTGGGIKKKLVGGTKGKEKEEEKNKEREKRSDAELKAGWITEEEPEVKQECICEGAGNGEDRERERFAAKTGVDMESIIFNDKWQQLCQMYPVIHPYEDDRQYISIQPKDFVIMTGDCQHLANNSFLLHGFYNYRHIILGNEREEGGFYLGVPGVYYEREKMVALMFGFEAFECSGGKAEAGKFGYYLRKVNI